MFSRLTDVINANLHSLLDKSEEPDKMLRLMIDEMKQVQIQEWSDKAELAIQKG